MPFKVFVLSAGVFGFPLKRFVITLFVARGLRYSVWSALAVLYGGETLQLLKTIDAWFADRLGALVIVAACLVFAAFIAFTLRRRPRSEVPEPE
jgi:threonine/homoserine efflux transporter RhtA